MSTASIRGIATLRSLILCLLNVAICSDRFNENKTVIILLLLFTNWVQGPYQEIQAQGFSYSPSLRGLFGK